MITSGNIGTVTLRVVGINRDQDPNSRHPIIMTGVAIRLRPHVEYDDAARPQGAAHHIENSGPDGCVIFRVLPGRYDVLADSTEIKLDTIDVTAGCDLIYEIKLWTGMTVSISATGQPDDLQLLLNVDTLIPRSRRLLLRIEWTSADEKYWGGSPPHQSPGFGAGTRRRSGAGGAAR